ncbi:TonB-dependent receptor [Caulobacter hibisci]|uniref:TonB-dependent receptor n=1 Tax=Caulobacter hibisci TaxID=2035993 RepID=A0ABS0SVD2_9CAUL|nr:TonB-dependent receptor [Caulobacter hibisci]MBI1683607.1 TonB-dependent receptor [Caulobacter hibisci]
MQSFTAVPSRVSKRLSFKAILLASAMLAAAGAQVEAAPLAAETPADPTEIDSVVIVANRNDAAQAQLKAATAVSVLSAEDLEHTAVHNVAEALGMMPSVNVMNTGSSFFGGIDGASRGEGMFVSIRGLNAEFNVNMINGVTVAQGMPYSRQVQLSLLPPSGLHTIVLNKTSTADMDGDAIGGTVDFRTPSAFDFRDGFNGSVTASGRLESRARDYGDEGLGGGLSAEWAHRFGPDQTFGLYASAFYDKRNYANSEMAGVMAATNDGGWSYLVRDAAGNSYPGLDPEKNITQTGLNVGVSNGYTERWGGNFTLEWRPGDTLTAYLRGSYAFAKTEQNSTLSQFVSASKSYKETVAGSGRYNLSVDAISTRVWYETNPEEADLGTLQLGADKTLGAWTLSPQIFYSEGDNDRPNHIEASVRINQSDRYNNGSNRALGGLSIGYSDDLPRPLFTQAIYDDLNNANTALLARRAGQLTEQFSGQEKYGFKFDAKRVFEGGSLQWIKLGGKYVDSHRRVTNRDWTNDHFANLLGQGGVTWQSLGIATSYYDQVFPGEYTWRVPKVNHQALVDYFYKYKTAASFDTCGSDFTNNMNCNTQKGDEAVASLYATANYSFGDVEVVPGLRYEHTKIDNTYWVIPSTSGAAEQTGFWSFNSTEYNEVLPSVFVTWRPNDATVYRGSVWTSYTRPAFIQLAGGERRQTGDDGKVTITRGNPDLKPIRAINLDLSGEWSSGKGGYAMFGGFYKHLSNYMYDNGSSSVNSDHYAEDGKTTVYVPTNGGDGDVYGLELQLRQKFTELPGLLSGLGAGVNVTRQWTSVDLGDGVDNRIQNAPDWVADAQLFYQKGGFSLDVIYHYTGAYVASYDVLGTAADGWDNLWVRPLRSVDLHVGYAFDNGLKVDLSVANLLKDYSYWSHIGEHSLALSDVVDSGRTTLLTVKKTF